MELPFVVTSDIRLDAGTFGGGLRSPSSTLALPEMHVSRSAGGSTLPPSNLGHCVQDADTLRSEMREMGRGHSTLLMNSKPIGFEMEAEHRSP